MAQLSLLSSGDFLAHWCPDSYETTTELAAYMAGMLGKTDFKVLEPAAGSGQICKAIRKAKRVCEITAIEIRLERFRVLSEKKTPFDNFVHGDFLEWGAQPVFDVVVANPPFSKALDFIERSLISLNSSNPQARLLYLLPAAFFQSKERGRQFKQLDCRIYQRHSIIGRVAYLKNGAPMTGRQCEDCVFDIRPGRNGDSKPEVFFEV